MASKQQAAAPRREHWRVFVGLEAGTALSRPPARYRVVVWRRERVPGVLNTRAQVHGVVWGVVLALPCPTVARVVGIVEGPVLPLGLQVPCQVSGAGDGLGDAQGHDDEQDIPHQLTPLR